MIKSGIYKITSPTGRVYIGQSVDIKNRLRVYKSGHGYQFQPKLRRSCLKYGFDNHKFEIIEEVEAELLNDRERYWQDRYDVINSGLNCFLTKSSDKSGRVCKETLVKLGRKKEEHWCWGKKRPDASKRMTSNNPMKLDENKKKVSDKRKGVKLPASVRDKMRGRTGLKNPKGVAVVSLNTITGERLVMGMNETARHFNVDKELIRNVAIGATVKRRKLLDWQFSYK